MQDKTRKGALAEGIIVREREMGDSQKDVGERLLFFFGYLLLFDD